MPSTKYKATGIILRGKTLKETDRLLTVLTPEYGLLRAIAPGAKKLKSRLRGRTELFVVNELLIVKGRSLDKVIQAETLYTYPALSQDIGRLAAAQYLGELALYLAVDEQPQVELYELLNEHLRRIEAIKPQQSVYPFLVQGMFHLLAVAGIAPQVQACCQSKKTVTIPELDHKWRGGLRFDSGGVVFPNQEQQSETRENQPIPATVQYKINPIELAILQHLSDGNLPNTSHIIPTELTKSLSVDAAWLRIEEILRQYIKHYLGKSIRSASLVTSLYQVEF